MKLPSSSVKLKGLNAGFPIYDIRDGAEHSGFQMKTPSQYVPGLAWNAYMMRGRSGIYRDHEKELVALVKRARKAGETVLFADMANFGVSVYVAI